MHIKILWICLYNFDIILRKKQVFWSLSFDHITKIYRAHSILGISKSTLDIERQNKNRLYVELPGVQDEVTVAEKLQSTANLQFFDGIKSSDIQEILIRSANDLIDLESPNYQYVAARLLLFSLRKSVYGGHPDNHPTLLTHVKKCAEGGV